MRDIRNTTSGEQALLTAGLVSNDDFTCVYTEDHHLPVTEFIVDESFGDSEYFYFKIDNEAWYLSGGGHFPRWRDMMTKQEAMRFIARIVDGPLLDKEFERNGCLRYDVRDTNQLRP